MLTLSNHLKYDIYYYIMSILRNARNLPDDMEIIDTKIHNIVNVLLFKENRFGSNLLRK